VGKKGRVVAREYGQYRVKLDEPVKVKGVGLVKDDLWDAQFLKKS
jgi:hypothetical protein